MPATNWLLLGVLGILLLPIATDGYSVTILETPSEQQQARNVSLVLVGSGIVMCVRLPATTNPFMGAVARLSTTILSVTNATAEGFAITHFHSVDRTLRPNEAVFAAGPKRTVEGRSNQAIRITLSDALGPCEASFLQQPILAQNVSALSCFQSNVTLRVGFDFSSNLTQAQRITNGTDLQVPTEQQTFLTYMPHSLDYDLLVSLRGSDSINSQLQNVTVCSVDMKQVGINLLAVNETSWNRTFSDLTHPTFLELWSVVPSPTIATISLSFFETGAQAPDDGDGDGLKTWQIVLIAVGGGGLVLVVVVLMVSIAYFLWKRHSSYEHIN